MIRASAKKSELQPESQTYRPKVRDSTWWTLKSIQMQRSLLTGASFLLTSELLRLQLCLGAFFICCWNYLTYNRSFLAYSGKAHLISASTDCKQRSATVGRKAPTVSKQASLNSEPDHIEKLQKVIGLGFLQRSRPSALLCLHNSFFCSPSRSCLKLQGLILCCSSTLVL